MINSSLRSFMAGDQPEPDDDIVKRAWDRVFLKADREKRWRMIEARSKSLLFPEGAAPELADGMRDGPIDPRYSVEADPRKANAYTISDREEELMYGEEKPSPAMMSSGVGRAASFLFPKEGFVDDLGERTAVGAYDFLNGLNLGTRGVAADFMGDEARRDELKAELDYRKGLGDIVADRKFGGGLAEIQGAEGFIDTAKAIALNIGEAAPSTLASMALGGGLAKGAQLGLRGVAALSAKAAPAAVKAATAMSTPLSTGGVGLLGKGGKAMAAAKAIKAAPGAAAVRLGSLAALGAPGVLPSTEETYLEAREAGKSLPYALSGLAINTLAQGAAEAVGIESITGKGLSKLLKPGASALNKAAGVTARTVTAGLSEGVTESLQEGIGYSIEKSMGIETGHLAYRLANAFSLGALTGGAFGATIGAGGRLRGNQAAETQDGETSADPAKDTAVEANALEPGESPYEAALSGQAAFADMVRALKQDSPTYADDIKMVFQGQKESHRLTTAQQLPGAMSVLWDTKIADKDIAYPSAEELELTNGDPAGVVVNRRVEALRLLIPDAPPEALAGMAVSKEAFMQSGAMSIMNEVTERRFDIAFLASLREVAKENPHKELNNAIKYLQRRVKTATPLAKRKRNHSALIPGDMLAPAVAVQLDAQKRTAAALPGLIALENAEKKIDTHTQNVELLRRAGVLGNGSPEQKVQLLRRDGINEKDANDLINGRVSPQALVDRLLGTRFSVRGEPSDADTMIIEENGDGSRTFSFTPDAGPASASGIRDFTMSHGDAIELARQRGVERILEILEGEPDLPPGMFLKDIIDPDGEWAEEAQISPKIATDNVPPTLREKDLDVSAVRKMLAVFETEGGEQVVIPLGQLRSYRNWLRTPDRDTAAIPLDSNTEGALLKATRGKGLEPSFFAQEDLGEDVRSRSEAFRHPGYELNMLKDRSDKIVGKIQENFAGKNPRNTGYTGKKFYSDLRSSGLSRGQARRVLRITGVRAGAMGLTIDEYLPKFLQGVKVNPGNGRLSARIGHAASSGQAIIETFGKANPSVILHELAHHWRLEIAAVDPKLHADIAAFVGADDDVNSEWTVQQDEFFATAMERYFFDGHGDPKGQTIWERFKRWLRDMTFAVTSLKMAEDGSVRFVGSLSRQAGYAEALRHSNVAAGNEGFDYRAIEPNAEFIELMNRMFVADSVELMQKDGTLGKSEPGFAGEPLEPAGERAMRFMNKVANPQPGAPPATAMPNDVDIVTEKDMLEPQSFMTRLEQGWETFQVQMTSRHIWGEKVAAKLKAAGHEQLGIRIETAIRQMRAATAAANRVINDETFGLAIGANGQFEYHNTGEGLRQVFEGVDDETFKDLQNMAVAERYIELNDRKYANTLQLIAAQNAYDSLQAQRDAAIKAGNTGTAKALAKQMAGGRPKITDMGYNDARFIVHPEKYKRQVATMAAMKQKYGSDMVNMEAKLEQFRAWSERAILDRLVEVGRLSKEQKAQIKAKNGKWAHLQYVVGEEFDPDLSKVFGEVAEANPIKYMREGVPEGKVFEPIAASARLAQTVQIYVQRQHVINLLASAADQFPELGLELSPAENKPGQKARAKSGAGLRGPNANPYVTQKKATKNYLLDKPVAVWRNGQRTEYYGSAAALETMQVLENYSPKVANAALSILVNGLKAATRVKRIMTTTTPGFVSRNIGRDQIAAYQNSRSGNTSTAGGKLLGSYRPVIDLWRGLRLATRGKFFGMDIKLTPQEEQWIAEHDRNMAGLGGLISSDMMDVMGDVEDIRKGVDLNSVSGIAHQAKRANRRIDYALAPMIYLGQILEQGTRMGAFARTRQLGGSMDLAVSEARESTLDFTRGGLMSMRLSGVEAFFNPNVQDMSKMARNFRQSPGTTLLRILVATTLPAIANRLANGDDEEWHRLHDWDRALFYHFKSDSGGFWRIPRGIGMVNAIFGYGVDKFIDHMEGKDPHAGRSFLSLLVESSPLGTVMDVTAPSPSTAALPMVPDLFQPVADVWANRDSFRGTTIDPERERNLDPLIRGAETGGPAVGMIARGMNALNPFPDGPSSYDIRYLLGQYLGGYGRMGLEGANAAGRKLLGQSAGVRGRGAAEMLGFASSRPIGFSSKPVVELMGEFKEVEQSYNTLRKLLTNGNRDAYLAYSAAHPELKYYPSLKRFAGDIRALRDLRDGLVRIDNGKLKEEQLQTLGRKITLIDESATQRAALALDLYYRNRYKKGYTGAPVAPKSPGNTP